MFSGAASDESAGVPARDVVAALVRRSWKRLRREVRRAGKRPSADELHRIRILAKRARYAAEAAAEVVGKPAARFAAAIEEVQTVLGDHHDAAVAEGWLRNTARESPAAGSGVAAGLLIARQRRDRERLERSWRATWKGASASRLRRWF
jgi:CHAD domain-containing protein